MNNEHSSPANAKRLRVRTVEAEAAEVHHRGLDREVAVRLLLDVGAPIDDRIRHGHGRVIHQLELVHRRVARVAARRWRGEHIGCFARLGRAAKMLAPCACGGRGRPRNGASPTGLAHGSSGPSSAWPYPARATVCRPLGGLTHVAPDIRRSVPSIWIYSHIDLSVRRGPQAHSAVNVAEL